MCLSRAHDLLTSSHWEGARMADVAAAAVQPFCDDGRPAFMLHGPEVTLNPRVALSLSMAFHELATNAAKYGALSTAEGRVEIRWETSRDELRIRWQESGGPPVATPLRRGFGTRLIERTVAGELNGKAVPDFAPTGLSCEIVMPLEK
jgi:two-component sensor histidine kinase